jgi:hypothetical protein
MSKLFAGSNANLIATRRHVIEDVFTPRLRDALAQSADEVQLFRNFFLVPALRSWGGQLDFISFMEEHGKHVGEVCAFLEGKGIRADIENLDKSLDSLALAGKITKWLNEFSDLKEKDEPEKEKSEAKEKPEESEEEAEKISQTKKLKMLMRATKRLAKTKMNPKPKMLTKPKTKPKPKPKRRR